MRNMNLEEINCQFNNELQLQIEGKLPKGHIYQLGKPEKALLDAGIADLPIELSATKLTDKSSKSYRSKHPFDISEAKNLPKAINEPVAVFKSTKLNDDSKIILTELKRFKSGNKLTLWLDKKKALNFVSTQSTNLIGGGNKEGLFINIVNNFQNVK
jgi:hypothetical protein